MFTQIQWPTLIQLLLFVSHYPTCCHLFDLHNDSCGNNCYYLHFTEKDTVADRDRNLTQVSMIRAWMGILGLNSGPLNQQLLYWTIVSSYLPVGDLRPWSGTGWGSVPSWTWSNFIHRMMTMPISSNPGGLGEIRYERIRYTMCACDGVLILGVSHLPVSYSPHETSTQTAVIQSKTWQVL